MSSFVSGDSAFVGGAYSGAPISGSPFVVKNSEGGLNINTSPLEDTGVNLSLENDGADVVYTGGGHDIVAAGGGDDILNAGDGDDFIDGGDGSDILRGGDGDDVIKGGKGADILIGGHGADLFVISGDEGAFGADSDLTFDGSELLVDQVLDFNDHEDVLVLQDLGLEGGTGSVEYDSHTGEVILKNEGNGDEFVVAKLQPGLDIAVVDQGGGNWTLL